MKAFKGFRKDLTCMGYQFKLGEWNEEKEANCYKNGLHCAENPLDVLGYYPNVKESVYYIVEAAGDIHEDGSDTKISCTRMFLHKKLSIHELVFYGVKFMVNHPDRKNSAKVNMEKGSGNQYYCIVRGKHPIGKGPKGCRLYLIQEEAKGSSILSAAIYEIDGTTMKPDTYYGIDGKEVCDNAGKERTPGHEGAVCDG